MRNRSKIEQKSQRNRNYREKSTEKREKTKKMKGIQEKRVSRCVVLVEKWREIELE